MTAGAAHCERCRFAAKHPKRDERGAQIIGECTRTCRRFPPTAIGIPNAQGVAVMAQFPPVDRTMVCQEFQPDPDAEPEVPPPGLRVVDDKGH